MKRSQQGTMTCERDKEAASLSLVKKRLAKQRLAKVMRCVAPVIGEFVHRQLRPLRKRIVELEKGGQVTVRRDPARSRRGARC